MPTAIKFDVETGYVEVAYISVPEIGPYEGKPGFLVFDEHTDPTDESIRVLVRENGEGRLIVKNGAVVVMNESEKAARDAYCEAE